MKRAGAGEEGKESPRGTLGREKKRERNSSITIAGRNSKTNSNNSINHLRCRCVCIMIGSLFGPTWYSLNPAICTL